MTVQKNAASTIKSTTADLRQDIENLKHDAYELAQHAVEAGSRNASQLRDQAADQIDTLKEAGKKNLARVEKRIREKPGQSLAIAFAAGALLSLLMGRK